MAQRDQVDWNDVARGVLSIASGVVTIRQATKRCPCDGTPLPFKTYCPECNHLHIL